MSRFDRIRGRRRENDDLVVVRSWPYRHPAFSSIIVVALVGAAVALWAPWQQTSRCGPGLTAVGSPYICVGLDLDSSPLRAADPVADLERKVAADDAKVTGSFATIVILEDTTPDPATDSVALLALRHEIEGAITAMDQANSGSGAAGGDLPKIKLLLANFGGLAAYGPQAVDAIEGAESSDHIVAVTGIGQSLDATRDAIEQLSQAGITTVGSDVTADDLNVDASGTVIPDFFRVSPTNSDEAAAAAQYIGQNLHDQQVLLVQDDNTQDIYAQTLASAFKSKFPPRFTETFQSPDESLADVSRQDFMTQQFANEHSDICADRPDLIFFAGRGIDLEYFLDALESGGACSLGPVTVMSGDDTDNLVGVPLPTGPVAVKLLYISLATSAQWPMPPAGGTSSGAAVPSSGTSSNALLADEYDNYQSFATAFAAAGFAGTDLIDGEAITMHDAVYTAATAVRNDSLAVANPATVASFMLNIRCRNTVGGASGFIAFNRDTHNPVDKTMVVMQIDAEGSATQEALTWPAGSQENYFTSTC
jgi:hypothetical protein